MAFPYIATSGKDALESSLVSGMSEICGQNFGFSNVRFSESCSMEGDNFQKLSDLHSVHVNQLDNCVLHFNFSDLRQRSDIFFLPKKIGQDYLFSRMEKRSNGEADLVVFCHKGSDSSKEVEHPDPDSESRLS